MSGVRELLKGVLREEGARVALSAACAIAKWLYRRR